MDHIDELAVELPPLPSMAPGAIAADGFELLARLCPDGVLIIQNDHIVYACPAADTILCPTPKGGDLLGRAPLTLVLPAHHARVRERLAQAAAGAFMAPEELALCSVDARCFDAELSCGPFIWRGQPALQMLVRGRPVRHAEMCRQYAEHLAARDQERN